MIRFKSAGLQEAARNRKPGYMEAVLAAATVVTDEIMEMPKDVYQEIAEKYSLGGPGAELKKLLKMIGVVATPTCQCNQRAKHMDKMGCQWCRDNEEEICDWMQEEARKRGMLFVRSVARLMLKRAIAIADRNKNERHVC